MSVGHPHYENYEGTIIVEEIEDQTIKVPIVLNFNPSDLLEDNEQTFQFPMYEITESYEQDQNQPISIRTRSTPTYIPRKQSLPSVEIQKQLSKRNSISNDEFLKQMKMESTYQPMVTTHGDKFLDKYLDHFSDNTQKTNITQTPTEDFKRIGKQLEEIGKKSSVSVNSFAQFEEIVKAIQKNGVNGINFLEETPQQPSNIMIQQVPQQQIQQQQLQIQQVQMSQQPVTKPPINPSGKRYSLDGKISLPRLPSEPTSKKRNSISERRNSQDVPQGKRNSNSGFEGKFDLQRKKSITEVSMSSFDQEKKKFMTELEEIGLLRKNSVSTPTSVSTQQQNTTTSTTRRNSGNRKLSDQSHTNFMFHVYTPENEQNQPKKNSSTPDVFHMYLPNQPKQKKTQKPTFSISTQTFHVYSPDTQTDDKKRKKKTKEKRGSKKRSKISTKEIQRIDESLSEKFLVISRKIIPNEDSRADYEFNVYSYNENNISQVFIGLKPTCSCNDFEKGSCKHLFFCFLKILGVSRDSDLIFQKALLSSELESIEGNDVLLKKNEFCYLCCNPLVEKELTYCRLCGTKVHSDCWKKCCTINSNHGCLFCEKK